MSLIEEGQLEPATTARSVLAGDLPLIDDQVTVEQLLAHRSGIGDYVDEEADHAVTDNVLPVPVHELAATEQYLRVLDGHPGRSAPDERFSYSNSGYVVLALLAERTSGMPFHELVQQRVYGPAGMKDTAFLRSDELPGRAAHGYLAVDGLRTNVLHLPVRGSGDGGIYSTAADIGLGVPPTRCCPTQHRAHGRSPDTSTSSSHPEPPAATAIPRRPADDDPQRRHRDAGPVAFPRNSGT